MIIFEVNARLGHRDLHHLVDAHVDRAASLGFDWIWLMGLWRTGPASVAVSRTLSPDFEGSPYAIAEYEVGEELGGDAALAAFVERAHARGLEVMADFVPNHMAVDSPLIDAEPGFAIHWNPALRDAHPSDYFDHPKGRLAHGKDPYFAGWTDTVQLDYSHPGLRAHQIDVLKRIAARVDGVRCDMAMLVLREHVKAHWFPRVGREAFDAAFPEEFWREAIRAVRAERPGFRFMAEVYWDKEPELQWLGFDHTYDKKLYDLLANGSAAEDVARYLHRAHPDYLTRTVHFLENHDEERAAVRFGRRARPAALVSFAIPGAVFVHQGQMEGFREKLPVQRRVPREVEVPDEDLERFYARLLACVKDPLYREGRLEVVGVEQGLLLFLRRHEGRLALVGAELTAVRGESPPLELSLHRLGLSSGARVTVRDRWLDVPVDVSAGLAEGVLRLPAGALAGFGDVHGFLLEIDG
jgi:glycosidase